MMAGGHDLRHVVNAPHQVHIYHRDQWKQITKVAVLRSDL